MKFSIPWFKKNRVESGRLGITVRPDGIAIAHLAEGQLRYCQLHAQPEDRELLLTDLVEAHGWKGTPCSIVLHPAYYQLMLVESPPVQTDEMSSAVRWLVKELLDFPVEEAAIEYFSLPDDAYRGRQKMLYVAALRKHTLQGLVEPAQNSGLNVDCVEVAELALHNLVARLPKASGATALVQLYEGEGFINLVEEGSVYLCRRLDVGLSQYNTNADNQQFFESLLLEIQRSLDYYESQLGKGIVATLYYSPGVNDLNIIGQFLSDQLGVNVNPFTLEPFNIEHGINDTDQPLACISAIGSAYGPMVVTEEEMSAAS